MREHGSTDFKGQALAPLGDATQELVEGVRKLPYAVFKQFRGDHLERDAKLV